MIVLSVFPALLLQMNTIQAFCPALLITSSPRPTNFTFDVVIQTTAETNVTVTLPASVTRICGISCPDVTDVSSVILRHNSLEDIRLSILNNGLNPCHDIRALDLSYNHIVALYNDSFSLPSATRLWLDHNSIQWIQNDAFSRLASLRLLSLRDNSLHLLTDWLWVGNLPPSLQQLLLDNNRLSVAPPSDALTSLSVQTLGLSGNCLSNITSLQALNINTLDLSGNNLTEFAGLNRFSAALRQLTLDGNPVPCLPSGSIQDLPALHTLSLCHMARLAYIDEGAIDNLPYLSVLYLYNNPSLVYLSSRAFLRLPSLSQLHLHNSNLAAVPYDLVRTLPLLTHLRVDGNPLLCDCNARWLPTCPAVLQPHLVRCQGPHHVAGYPLLSVRALPVTCAPTLVHLQPPVLYSPVDSPVSLQCRAVGVPEPVLAWRLSATLTGAFVDDGQGRLEISAARGSDAGSYTCNASSLAGWSSSATVLQVYSPDAQIVVLTEGPTSISFTWTGTGATRWSCDYVALYREVTLPPQPYSVVDLRAFMRQYTVHKLRPGSTYQLCLGYRRAATPTVLHCRTTDTVPGRPPTHFHLTWLVTWAAVVAALGVLVLCCTCCRVYGATRKRISVFSYRKIGSETGTTIPLLYLTDKETVSTVYYTTHGTTQNTTHDVTQDKPQDRPRTKE